MNKPVILAIETATPACSVALYAETIFSRCHIGAKEHTQHILPMVSSLLEEAKLSLHQIELIAVGIGPGSFSGVRIGVSVTQALSFGLNLPLYPIPTLEVLAYEASHSEGWEEGATIIAGIDARMDEVFSAVYQVSQGLLTTLVPAQLISGVDLITLCRSFSNPIVLGSGWDKFYTPQLPVRYLKDVTPHARQVARIALRQYQMGKKGEAPETVIPYYLRDKVAEKSVSA